LRRRAEALPRARSHHQQAAGYAHARQREPPFGFFSLLPVDVQRGDSALQRPHVLCRSRPIDAGGLGVLRERLYRRGEYCQGGLVVALIAVGLSAWAPAAVVGRRGLPFIILALGESGRPLLARCIGHDQLFRQGGQQALSPAPRELLIGREF
jgi:hypothetical protein